MQHIQASFNGKLLLLYFPLLKYRIYHIIVFAALFPVSFFPPENTTLEKKTQKHPHVQVAMVNMY